MSDNSGSNPPPGLNRRTFLSALGAAAAAGTLLQQGEHANAQSQTYYYQDSFGNIVPAGNASIELGVYPPPVLDFSEQDDSEPSLRHGGHLRPADDPPPGSCGYTGLANTSFYTCGYPVNNILLIIVDQMRSPSFWVPPATSGGSGQTLVNNAIQNIWGLAKQSFSFPNYWVSATICGPSRACLLTGLYSQQHGMFKTKADSTYPSLLPYNNSLTPTTFGFPTIGNVLSQVLPVGNSSDTRAYNCTWIGKWHLSCSTGSASDSSVGANGPSDYGFDSNYNLPSTPTTGSPYPEGSSHGYPSPNGLSNEGWGGDFIDSSGAGRDVVGYTPTLGNGSANNSWALPASVQLNDAAIAGAFQDIWLPFASTSFNQTVVTSQLAKPWFCAVSFINPHDISDFPLAFGVQYTDPTDFPPKQNPPGNNNYSGSGFQIPNGMTAANISGNNCPGSDCTTNDDFMQIVAAPNPYTSLPPGGSSASTRWNFENVTAPGLSYANNGKPGLQSWFVQGRNQSLGEVLPAAYNATTNTWTSATGWETFLNYYLWLEACVDFQVGRVLGTNTLSGVTNNGLAQSIFANNTVVIFTSDHGEYAGSHSMRSKGCAAYEEALNVPLYISYPSMRNHAVSGPYVVPYVCSSVDLLPYLYTLALGNAQWRGNNNDMIYHLANREDLADAIYTFNNNIQQVFNQRRISSIPQYQPQTGFNGNQPYILSTADDYEYAPISAGNYQPSHIIAFRTSDVTDQNNTTAPFYGQNAAGGGKLVKYSYWDTCNSTAPPIYPSNNNQYEFYNYSIHQVSGSSLLPNLQEIGNQYFNTSGASQVSAFTTSFNSSQVQTELYNQYGYSATSGPVSQQVQKAIQQAYNNYISFLSGNGTLTNNNGGTSCAG